MTDEEEVKAVWSEASSTSGFNGTIWYVWIDPCNGTRTLEWLGQGHSESEAWQDAAARLRAKGE